MNRALRSSFSIVTVAACLVGCSGSHHTSAPSSGGSHVGSSASSSASSPAPAVTGEATLMLGTLRFTPKTVDGSTAKTFAGQEKLINSTGVLVKVSPGASVKPDRLTTPATMIWISDKYVLGTQDIKPCHSSCPSLTAPADTKQGLLIRSDAVREIATDTPVTKG